MVPCWQCFGSGVMLTKERSQITNQNKVQYEICGVCKGEGLMEAGVGAKALKERNNNDTES